MNQLRKGVIGPEVQIIPLEIIIDPFQSIVCLIIIHYYILILGNM